LAIWPHCRHQTQEEEEEEEEDGEREKKQIDTAADFTAQELEECAAMNVQ